MSVIFHLATREEWERATRTGAYTTASLDGEGFIHCSTATQHAAVANAHLAGQTDLVLLLIDTDKLSSAVRFERPDAGGEAFPHVYGPIDLDAVFEATPYRPGPDGRFHPHEEASGFAAHGATTLAETKRRAIGMMTGFVGPWWVAGGWALDLFLGHKTRPHADLEISVLATDQRALFEHLRDWDLRLAAPGASLPAWDGSRIQPPFHQVWARRAVGRPSSPEEFAADPTMLGFLLEQSHQLGGCIGVTPPSRGHWTRSGRRPRTVSPSCVRRSRCCSRQRQPGSRTSGTSTASCPAWTGWHERGWDRRWSRRIPGTSGMGGHDPRP
jgi:uncharacterized protein (DUF952 family)